MASILCKSGSVLGWRDEDNTSGLYKFKKDSATSGGWHLNQDSGTYLFKDGNNLGWRYKAFSVQLGSMALGSLVKIKVNNIDKSFMVVQHGRPSPSYDASFDGGTILIQRVMQETAQWHSSMQAITYWGSTMNTVTLPTYFNAIDPVVRNKIMSVRIMAGYFTGNNTGAQLMWFDIFLPSILEFNCTIPTTINHPNDGEAWNYFKTNDASMFYGCWSRTPNGGSGTVQYGAFYPTGNTAVVSAINSSHYYCPAFVIPQTTLVDANGYVL